MTQETPAAAPERAALNPDDIRSAWDGLEPGPKARAMRSVYEEQQKLVTELQRQHMEMGTDIAIAIAKARAAEELGRGADRDRIIEGEVKPKIREQQELGSQIQEAIQLLNAYVTIGKGII